jgi:hypothetical protein
VKDRQILAKEDERFENKHESPKNLPKTGQENKPVG